MRIKRKNRFLFLRIMSTWVEAKETRGESDIERKREVIGKKANTPSETKSGWDKEEIEGNVGWWMTDCNNDTTVIKKCGGKTLLSGVKKNFFWEQREKVKVVNLDGSYEGGVQEGGRQCLPSGFMEKKRFLCVSLCWLHLMLFYSWCAR